MSQIVQELHELLQAEIADRNGPLRDEAVKRIGDLRSRLKNAKGEERAAIIAELGQTISRSAALFSVSPETLHKWSDNAIKKARKAARIAPHCYDGTNGTPTSPLEDNSTPAVADTAADMRANSPYQIA